MEYTQMDRESLCVMPGGMIGSVMTKRYWVD